MLYYLTVALLVMKISATRCWIGTGTNRKDEEGRMEEKERKLHRMFQQIAAKWSPAAYSLLAKDPDHDVNKQEMCTDPGGWKMLRSSPIRNTNLRLITNHARTYEHTRELTWAAARCRGVL